MSDQVLVRCPHCCQKYRVKSAVVGHRAKCAKCSQVFVVSTESNCDEETILSWITEGQAPSESSHQQAASDSVMGSTGLFNHPPPATEATQAAPQSVQVAPAPQPQPTQVRDPEPQPSQARIARPEDAHPQAAPAEEAQHDAPAATPASEDQQHVRLVRFAGIDQSGASFEFPISAVTNEALRDSFPHKCVGCGSKHGLFVHLLHWPDRMNGHEAAHWKQYQAAQVGDWDKFAAMPGHSWLRRLPSSLRHNVGSFNLPFPFLLCKHCPAGEVQARIVVQGNEEVCRLTIRSLATAVEFFRNNGGRHTPEYQELIEQRNIRHDRRNELNPDVRARLAHWFAALPGEQFVHYFPDAEFLAAEEGNAGAVLTVRRLVFKKFAAYRDYSLHAACRLEVKSDGGQAVVQIFEQGHRPAVLNLTDADANQLVFALQSLSCHWHVVRE